MQTPSEYGMWQTKERIEILDTGLAKKNRKNASNQRLAVYFFLPPNAIIVFALAPNLGLFSFSAGTLPAAGAPGTVPLVPEVETLPPVVAPFSPNGIDAEVGGR